MDGFEGTDESENSSSFQKVKLPARGAGLPGKEMPSQHKAGLAGNLTVSSTKNLIAEKDFLSSNIFSLKSFGGALKNS